MIRLICFVLLIGIIVVVYIVISNWFQKIADKMIKQLQKDNKEF